MLFRILFVGCLLSICGCGRTTPEPAVTNPGPQPNAVTPVAHALPVADRPAKVETLADLERLALQAAVEKLTDPALPSAGARKRLHVGLDKVPGFSWCEIGSDDTTEFVAKHFPRTSFFETECVIKSHQEWSRTKYALDRKTGATRRIQRTDIDGILHDEAVFVALVAEARVTLNNEADVQTFVSWANSIADSPRALRFVCGNSKFGSQATKLDDGWKFLTAVDWDPNRAWKISCDTAGIVTGIDRNLGRLPSGPTREQNRARRLAEMKRREDATPWWVQEAKQADLAELVAKSDLIGIADDFTSYSGTGGVYRVFTFGQGDLLFGDRLGNYSKDFYIAAVQFSAAMERRFEVDNADRWLVFLVARMDQGLHRDRTIRLPPAYDPAGAHAVLRCTEVLLAKVRELLRNKPTNAAREAAVRNAAHTEFLDTANSRTHILLARYAAKRVAEWSVEPLSADPEAVEARKRFRHSGVAYLRAAAPPERDATEADPAFQVLWYDAR
jgi:hypothetical protein